MGVGGTLLVNYSSASQQAATPTGFETPGVAQEESEPEVETVDETGYSPVPSDFEVDLIVKEQECFGSAGCNVTLRVEPSYVGTNVPTGTWEVTYEVTGIEDEPQIQTFTLDGSEVSYQPEINVQTTSRSAEPVAEVTDVYEGY